MKDWYFNTIFFCKFSFLCVFHVIIFWTHIPFIFKGICVSIARENRRYDPFSVISIFYYILFILSFVFWDDTTSFHFSDICTSINHINIIILWREQTAENLFKHVFEFFLHKYLSYMIETTIICIKERIINICWFEFIEWIEDDQIC